MDAQTGRALRYILGLAFLNLALGTVKNTGRILDPHVPIAEVPKDILLYLFISLSSFYWFYSVLSIVARGIGVIYAVYPVTLQLQGAALFAVLALSPLSAYRMWKYLDGTSEVKRFLLSYLAFALTSGLGIQMFPQA